ncbi:MAG: hypothetical protein JNL79_25825 [Myxococcales bacterium]|nr:hypothetical protein [Myxococcales bacterium]
MRLRRGSGDATEVTAMCLMVWLGSMRALPEHRLANPQVPDPRLGYHRVETVPDAAPVRARFTLPHVAYVGSHEGCGCGFNSGDLEWQGFELVAEIAPLIEALGAEERAEFEAEQRGRERLRDLVATAFADGPVEVFGCWAGDEGDPSVNDMEVDVSHFATRLAPIVERVRYLVGHSP